MFTVAGPGKKLSDSENANEHPYPDHIHKVPVQSYHLAVEVAIKLLLR